MAGIGSSLLEEFEKYSGEDFSNFLNINVEVTDLIPKGAKNLPF
jgi:hypothetical protein